MKSDACDYISLHVGIHVTQHWVPRCLVLQLMCVCGVASTIFWNEPARGQLGVRPKWPMAIAQLFPHRQPFFVHSERRAAKEMRPVLSGRLFVACAG